MTGRIENFKGGEHRTKILGAKEITDEKPVVLDYTTKQEQPPIEVVGHAEVITEDDKIRGRKITPGETEIRVREQPSQQEWDKIKRGEG